MAEYSTVKLNIHHVTDVALSGYQDAASGCMARKLCIKHTDHKGNAEWVEITIFDFDGDVRAVEFNADDVP